MPERASGAVVESGFLNTGRHLIHQITVQRLNHPIVGVQALLGPAPENVLGRHGPLGLHQVRHLLLIKRPGKVDTKIGNGRTALENIVGSSAVGPDIATDESLRQPRDRS